ncbi:MAG: succinate dehydrogenase, hydrophobic membrane anchor protein [Sphingobacteriia bacterium]|nr:succinate dehydrogenase, hydrophobic membrane anchor protein [Sphingobacteriia bacterium]
MNKSEFKSPLAFAKGLGSSQSGTGHFIHQRISAVLLLPLLLWFVVTSLHFLAVPLNQGFKLIAHPFNTIALLLTIIVSLYHGMLGMKVIIEDYVHKEGVKTCILLLLYGLTYFTMALGIISSIAIHIKYFINQ